MSTMSTNESTNVRNFRTIYTEKLTKEVTDKPQEYGYGPAFVPTVVSRMMASLPNKTANLSGPIKATAKALGIKPTMTAIAEYLNS